MLELAAAAAGHDRGERPDVRSDSGQFWGASKMASRLAWSAEPRSPGPIMIQPVTVRGLGGLDAGGEPLAVPPRGQCPAEPGDVVVGRDLGGAGWQDAGVGEHRLRDQAWMDGRTGSAWFRIVRHACQTPASSLGSRSPPTTAVLSRPSSPQAWEWR